MKLSLCPSKENKMSEIPEDISKRAYDLGLEIRCLLATHELIQHAQSVDDIIADAIWAERQRNAKIAEDEEGPSGDQFEQGWNSACFRISQAILNQTEE